MSRLLNDLKDIEPAIREELDKVFTKDSIVVVHSLGKHRWMTWEDLQEYAKKKEYAEVHHGVEIWNKSATFDRDLGLTHRKVSNVCLLVFDLDSKSNIEQARVEAIKVVKYLTNAIGSSIVEDGSLRIYFSGNKGFHIIGSPRALFFGVSGENGKTIREAANYYVSWVGQFLQLETLDDGVYRRDGTIRLANTCRHEKFKIGDEIADQFKIELSYEELQKLTISEMRELAKSQREPLFTDEQWFRGDISFRFLHHAQSILESCYSVQSNVPRHHTELQAHIEDLRGKIPVCMHSLHKMDLDGRRNKAIIPYICFLKDFGFTSDEAELQVDRFMTDISGLGSESKLRERIRQGRAAVRTIYNNPEKYQFGCPAMMGIQGRVNGELRHPRCKGSDCEFINPGSTDYKQQEFPRHPLIKITTSLGEGSYDTSITINNVLPEFTTVPTRVSVSCPNTGKGEDTNPTDFCGGCNFRKWVKNLTKKGAEIKSSGTARITDNGMHGKSELYGHEMSTLVDTKKSADRDHKIAMMMGVHRNCDVYQTSILEKGRMVKIVASSDPEFDKEITAGVGGIVKYEPMEVKMHEFRFFLSGSQEGIISTGETMPRLEYGDRVQVTVRPIETPYSPLVLVIEKLGSSMSRLDTFTVDEEVRNQLAQIRRINDPLKFSSLIKKVRAMEEVTGIYYRFATMLAVDIAWHSNFSLSLPKFISGRICPEPKVEENETVKGMIELLILGDPGQGKTTMVKRMLGFYGYGDMAHGPNISAAGLIGGVRTDGVPFIRWGMLPRQHKRMAVIDEFNRMDQRIMKDITAIRSEGIAKIEKMESGQVPARTRLMMMANVKEIDELGIVDLSSYEHGVKAIKDLMPGPQDVRRFDLIAINRKGDLETHTPLSHIFQKNTYPKELSETLLLWCWTRRADQIIWSSRAVIALEEYYLWIMEKLECDIPLADEHVLRTRIGRIAQSMAGMLVNTDSSYELIHVNEKHVEWAASFLYYMFCNNNAANLNLYAQEYQSFHKMSDGDLTFLEEWFEKCEENTKRVEDGEDEYIEYAFAWDRFCNAVKQGSFTRGGLESDLGWLDGDFKEFFESLRTRNMVRSKRSSGSTVYTPTPKLHRYIKQKIREDREEAENDEVDASSLAELFLDAADDAETDLSPARKVEPRKPPNFLTIVKEALSDKS